MTHFESEWFDDTPEQLLSACELIDEMRVRVCRYVRRGKLSEAEGAYLIGCSIPELRDMRTRQLKDMIRGKK